MQKVPFYEGMGLISEKQAVVIDIGIRYTKFGFAGESGPRCIIRSEVLCPKTNELQNIFDATTADEKYDLIVEFIHKLYFRHLLVSPKDRRVVVVESLLCPTITREMLAKVFFLHFEVSSVLFVPSHVVCLSTLGVNSALVVDMGTSETVVIPVYQGVAVLHAWQAQPLAGYAVERRISDMLLQSGDARTAAAANSLTESDIEDIKVRTCFVTTLERVKKSEAGHPPPTPPGVNYLVGRDNNSLFVSGDVRENAFNVLFEQDGDGISVPTMILDAILKCPIDMRRTLAENILLVGGTSMIPGMQARIQQELKHLSSTPPYADRLKVQTFKFHSAPAKENYTAWLGGAIYGATDIISTRSLSRETYLKDKRVPDWVSLLYNTINEGAKRSV